MESSISGRDVPIAPAVGVAALSTGVAAGALSVAVAAGLSAGRRVGSGVTDSTASSGICGVLAVELPEVVVERSEGVAVLVGLESGLFSRRCIVDPVKEVCWTTWVDSCAIKPKLWLDSLRFRKIWLPCVKARAFKLEAAF